MEFQETNLLEAFNEAFNRHDAGDMMALMTEDCAFENTYPPPNGTRLEGQASVKEFWEGFFRSSPQARIEIEEMFVNDDRGVQRWVYHWVDEKGDTGHVRGVDVFRFLDGKIAEKLSYVKG
jgi:ketosteroid isomerase-like protein